MDHAYACVLENSGAGEIDFSVNVNPLGVPGSLKENFSAIADISGAYPDPTCRCLVSHLAEKYRVSESCILCGNGAEDLLYRLVLAVKPQKAIIIEPTFEAYEEALHWVGCEVCHYATKPENRFLLDEGILGAIREDCDMLFLCNPNNPTGQMAERGLVQKIMEKCREKEVLLVVDECFMEFIPQWHEFTCKYSAAQSANIIVLDAFTKTFSLAGFRLGFCISGNKELLSRMRLCGQAYSVSAPAQFAGICALSDDSYWENTYRFLAAEREWLLSALEKLPLEIYSAYGNYFLVKTEMADIREKLLSKGIKVRDCSHFYALNSAYFRFAIRSHEENEILIKALQELLT